MMNEEAALVPFQRGSFLPMKRFLIISTTLLLVGCASYYQRNIKFQQAIADHHLDKAEKMLSENKRAQKEKNRFLYLVNMGYINHLQQEFELSNQFFNEADLMVEDAKMNLAYEALALISNPEVRPYVPEDFEPVMIHYYKALNYLNLRDYESVLVEAKRMNLTLNRLNDKYKDHKNRYQADAFANIIMAVAYEASGELNDAFIAYRNAFDIYSGEHGYFELGVPEQLKEDLLRTSFLLGFSEEHERFKRLFEVENFAYNPPKHGELFFLWHNGLGPVKDEWSVNFFVAPGQVGYVVFENEELGLTFPFYVGDDKQKQNDLLALQVVRVAFPKYLERPTFYDHAWLEVDGVQHSMSKVEDINAIAFKTLQDRFVREMASSLLRLATKKAAELALAEQDETLGAIATITNAITEKADTRNWQTLPHSIHYARIPLNDGDNEVLLKKTGQDGKKYSASFAFEGIPGKKYFLPYHSIEHFPAASWDKAMMPHE